MSARSVNFSPSLRNKVISSACGAAVIVAKAAGLNGLSAAVELASKGRALLFAISDEQSKAIEQVVTAARFEVTEGLEEWLKSESRSASEVEESLETLGRLFAASRVTIADVVASDISSTTFANKIFNRMILDQPLDPADELTASLAHRILTAAFQSITKSQSLAPQIASQSFGQIIANQNVHLQKLNDLVDKVAASNAVPLAALYQILDRLGQSNVAPEKIPEQLSIFVDRFNELRHQLSSRGPDGNSEDDTLRDEVQVLISSGNTNEAIQLIQARRKLIRKRMLIETEKEADLLMEEAEIDILNLSFGAAIAKLREAAELVGNDNYNWIVYRWKIIETFYDEGCLAENSAESFSKALYELEDLRSATIFRRLDILGYRLAGNEFSIRAEILARDARYDEYPNLFVFLEEQQKSRYQVDLLEASLRLAEHQLTYATLSNQRRFFEKALREALAVRDLSEQVGLEADDDAHRVRRQFRSRIVIGRSLCNIHDLREETRIRDIRDGLHQAAKILWESTFLNTNPSFIVSLQAAFSHAARKSRDQGLVSDCAAFSVKAGKATFERVRYRDAADLKLAHRMAELTVLAFEQDVGSAKAVADQVGNILADPLLSLPPVAQMGYHHTIGDLFSSLNQAAGGSRLTAPTKQHYKEALKNLEALCLTSPKTFSASRDDLRKRLASI